MESKSRSIACPFEFFETGERIVFEKLARLRAVTRASFSRVSRDTSSERESGRKTWSGKINRRQSSRDNETKLSSESISPRSLELSSKCTKRFLLPTFDSFLSNRSGKINNEPRIFFLLFPTNLHRLRILSFLSSPIISNDWRGLIHIKKDLNPIFNSDEFLNGGQSRKTWMKRCRGKVSLIVEQRQARRANSRQLGDPPKGVSR